MSTREEFERRLTAAEQKAYQVVEQLKNDVQAEIAEQKVLQAEIDRLKAALAKASDDPLLNALRIFVQDETKHIQKISGTEPGAEVDQTLPLVHVKTKIPLRTETRPLPEVSTLTTRGKIVALIRDGKLDAKKRQSEVSQLLPEGIHKLEVMGVLNKLVEEQVLLKIKEDATHVAFMRHPDVEVVKP